MSFKKKYPESFQFLAGYFPDADFDNITDEKVVLNYVTDCNKSKKSKIELKKVKRELLCLMIHVEVYWTEIGEEANRYFKNSKDTLKWLRMIYKELMKYE